MLSNLKASVNEAIEKFEDNRIMRLIANGELSLDEYHSLLVRLYHQVKNSSSSFAIAGGALAARDKPVSEYLIHHAEEEMTHYHWIEDDLKNSGYTGPAVAESKIPTQTMAYIALNYYCAHHHPYSRLAVAAVLEGISGTYGTSYGVKMIKQLDLTKDQAVFYLAHGELDQGHVHEVFEALEGSNMTEADYEHAILAAELAGKLYNDLYS